MQQSGAYTEGQPIGGTKLQVIRRLDGNRGSMAQVYLAARTDQPDAAPVVVKIANVYGRDDRLHDDALRREAAYLAELCHPHIVRPLPASDSATISWDFVGETEEGGYAYFVLEHLAGGSVSELLQRRGRGLSASEAVAIAYALATALDYVHARGLVHMDIAPHNVLLRADFDRSRLPDAVLIDFGSACRPGRQGFALHETFHASSFVPPEVVDAATTGVIVVHPKIDVYALGALLYTMLVGEPPFAGKEQHLLQQAILKGAYPPLAERWKPERNTVSLPLQQQLNDLVRLAMHADPADRCNAADMAQYLYAIGFQLGLWPAAKTRASGDKNGGGQRSLLAAFTALGILLFGAGAGFGFLAGNGLPPATATPSPTATFAATSTATNTSTPIPTPTHTDTPTPPPTDTRGPTDTPGPTVTPTATSTPTAAVRVPTATPVPTTPP